MRKCSSKVFCPNFRLSFVFIVAILFTGCGPRLSRAKAKEIISKHFKYPLSATLEINLDSPCYFMGWYPGSYNLFGSHKPCDLIVEDSRYVRSAHPWSVGLKNKGLMELAPYEGSDGALGIIASLTKEGLKYSTEAGLIKMADEEFLEVTGIKFAGDNKEAIVEYTWKYSNQTPFTKGTKYDDVKPKSSTATLALYDDGWRVTEATKND